MARPRKPRWWRRLKYKARGPLLYVVVLGSALGIFVAVLHVLSTPPDAPRTETRQDLR